MTVGIRAQTQEINAQIVEDFYEGPLSVAELMKKYGRSESSVNKLLAAYRLSYEKEHGQARVRAGKPKDPRLMQEKKSLSLTHFVIGLAITRYIEENKLTPTSFGMQISRSRVQVGNIMVGAHDLTLTEIARISEVLGIPMERLMQHPTTNNNSKEAKLHAVG